MEQVFFINPVAGKRDASAELVPQIQAAARRLQLPQPQIVVTQYAGQAREAARQYAASGTPAALYACGGDGTLNELVQGAAGSANVAVGCVPCGSGNDYVRNFGAAGQAPFLDFAAQLQAQPCRVDLLQTSLGIGIDICAAGLDAQVAYGIPKFRRLPGCGGTAAYTLSILQAMLSRFGHRLRVAIDGKEYTGTYMMAAITAEVIRLRPMQPWMTACSILCWSNPSPAFRLREFWPNTKPGSTCRMPIPSCRSSAAL